MGQNMMDRQTDGQKAPLHNTALYGVGHTISDFSNTVTVDYCTVYCSSYGITTWTVTSATIWNSFTKSVTIV